jgi:myo-inositol-1(or 4)-monophosphatase
LALRIAREAGDLLMTYYGRLDTVDRKGSVDFVTEADRASEQHLIETIHGHFPLDSVLAEEGGHAHQGENEVEWVLDPLDGTTNFIHGFPFFMVSIGLRIQGELVAGVCYGPYYQELFSAVRGHGATLNGSPIRVSRTDLLSDALLATGFPYNRREIMDPLLLRVRRALTAARGLRRAGAAAYDQCLLAAGRLDGFFEEGLRAWDVAAGALIVEEAGGQVSDYQGQPVDLFGPNFLMSNGRIHDELRRRIIDGETS